jgi:hypothetical protein
MKYKAKNYNELKENISSFNTTQNNLKQQEKQIIHSLENYLSEGYLFKQSFLEFAPFNIVDYETNNNYTRITGYSSEFISMFYGINDIDESLKKVKQSIKTLEKIDAKLYESLYHLWGKPLNEYKCHKSTLYRRINKAIKYIAKESNLLKQY